jgi:hypothetical protein
MEEVREGASQVPTFLIHINTKNLEQGTYSLNFDFTPAAPATIPAKPATKSRPVNHPRRQPPNINF